MKKSRPTRYPRRKPTRQAFLKIYQALRAHYGPRHWWPAETPFEVIVGAVLTQNTAWRNVEKAIENLKHANQLSVPTLRGIKEEELAGLIRPAGYFNIKARRLKNVIDFLSERYHGDLEAMFKEETNKLRKKLLEVNGIGQETADSILLYAGNKPSFVVDAYTRRVFERHRYLKTGEDYGMIQQIFMEFLPRSVPLYNDYHAQIVEVGKDFCRKTPLCSSCPLKPYL